MSWNNNEYPDSYKNLDMSVRKKAIEIANALLQDGMEEGRMTMIEA